MPDERPTIRYDDWYVVYLPSREVAAIEVGPNRELAVMFWTRRELVEQFLRHNAASGEVIHVFSRTHLRTHSNFAGLLGDWMSLGIGRAVVNLEKFGESDVLTISLSKFFALCSARTRSLEASPN